MLSGEATITNLIVFGMTRPGLEPMIYHTRGEHANHYATDAVHKFLEVSYSFTCKKKKRSYFKILGFTPVDLMPLQQYFSYIVAVSFIGVGNRSIRRNHRPAANH
jgi:hypothetical protein